MNTFVSFADQIHALIKKVVSSSELHARWLNTLSYLENCGARKIAACEHPTLVKEEMLKHAAEEFRHAHYLKRQITKISPHVCTGYADILGSFATLHYLQTLDVQASRYLQSCGFVKNALKEAAYILVTYAIELRAAELYPIYDTILRQNKSQVAVKSILLEEKEHLHEMTVAIAKLPSGFRHAEQVCRFEGSICKQWIEALII